MNQRPSVLNEPDTARLVRLFKDLHQNPELGYMEARTSEIVEKELRSLGYEVKTGIGKTGVVGILRNGEGPVVMYRGDMDANAVKEATGLSYASTRVVKRVEADGEEHQVPVAHLCGHDAHVTWLLGVAEALASSKAEWRGTLVLVAQPAEELGTGAKAMVHDGMYEKGIPEPDYLLGMHSVPFPTGMVICKPGEMNAGTDTLDVTFHGVGGHGSSPHLAKDPVLMACAAVVQYQFIVSRGIDPLNAAVVTVGSIQAGTDNNVIPDSALLKLNLRWYDEEDRARMLAAIERINQSIADAYALPEALRPTSELRGGTKVLSNDAEMAQILAPVLRELAGVDSVQTDLPKLMGSEDFHHLVLENDQHRYLYVYVGTAKPEHVVQAQAEGKPFPYVNHNPNYQVDLDGIPLGVQVGVAAVKTFLGRAGKANGEPLRA